MEINTKPKMFAHKHDEKCGEECLKIIKERDSDNFLFFLKKKQYLKNNNFFFRT